MSPDIEDIIITEMKAMKALLEEILNELRSVEEHIELNGCEVDDLKFKLD